MTLDYVKLLQTIAIPQIQYVESHLCFSDTSRGCRNVSFSEVCKEYKKWDIGVTWVKTETKLKFFIHSFSHSYKDLLRS